jgi:hypothetical protein
MAPGGMQPPGAICVAEPVSRLRSGCTDEPLPTVNVHRRAPDESLKCTFNMI